MSGHAKGGMLVAGLGFGVAAGVAAGALVIAPNLPDGAAQEINQVRAERDDAEERAQSNEAQAKAADGVAAGLAEAALGGQLDDVGVVVFAAASANPEDLSEVERLLEAAGAGPVSVIELTDRFFSSEGADELKSLVSNTLPAGAQLSEDNLSPGTHAGEALAAALIDGEDSDAVSDEDRELLLDTLADAGFLSYEGAEPAAAAVFVGGDSDGAGNAAFGAGLAAEFMTAVAGEADGAVLAARPGSAADAGAIGRVRSAGVDGLSTVDSLDRGWGRVATVLALAEALDGTTGDYGAAKGADAPVPRAN